MSAVASVDLWDKIQETKAYIQGKTDIRPEVGIILGTGLGGLGDGIQGAERFTYNELPNFPESTVEGHKGELILGHLEGQSVAVMEGRFHCYEGYSAEEVTYPVRVMQALGAKTLIISNAAGGLNLDYAAGDLMVVDDHINLMGVNPLVGPNDDRLGLRFPDMSAPYDKDLIALAKAQASDAGLALHEGVYVGVLGPNLETRAEYRFLRGIGADAVGMSTIPEVLAAVHAQMRILTISAITDPCDPDNLEPVTIEKVIEVAKVVEPKLTELVSRILKNLS